MGNRVKRVKTEVSESQMRQAIIKAWKELFNTTPTPQQVDLILAQNSLETGHRKSMWNFNVGNITTSNKSQYDFYDDLETKEQVKPGVWEAKRLKYRVYPNLLEGVKDYLRLLSSNKYSNAWTHIVKPNPFAFSKELKRAGYYTANEIPYTKAITRLYNQYQSQKKKPSSYDSTPTIVDVNINDNLNNMLDNYLKMVAASERVNRKLYKKYLPQNNVLITIKSSDYTNSVEFARILCSVLEEELVATAYTHTDGNNIEVDCCIAGPYYDCIVAVDNIVESTKSVFRDATKKIGTVNVVTNILSNKKSLLEEITFKLAEQQYRKFIIKFV